MFWADSWISPLSGVIEMKVREGDRISVARMKDYAGFSSFLFFSSISFRAWFSILSR